MESRPEACWGLRLVFVASTTLAIADVVELFVGGSTCDERQDLNQE